MKWQTTINRSGDATNQSERWCCEVACGVVEDSAFRMVTETRSRVEGWRSRRVKCRYLFERVEGSRE